MTLIDNYLATPDEINTTPAERVLSAVSGLVIIGMALTDKNSGKLSKWLKIGSGAALIYRAASGHCLVKKALAK